MLEVIKMKYEEELENAHLVMNEEEHPNHDPYIINNNEPTHKFE